MDIAGWNERYRSRERAAEDFNAPPTPLVQTFASPLKLGRALDIACGTGRNALWLAERGWHVTAVDAASEAICILQERGQERGLTFDAQIADLEKQEYAFEFESFDLIVDAYYLQRDLFVPAQAALKPHGLFISIVHTIEGTEQPTVHRTRPGELRENFAGWDILHDYEGPPADPAHRRAVAEIVARKPVCA